LLVYSEDIFWLNYFGFQVLCHDIMLCSHEPATWHYQMQLEFRSHLHIQFVYILFRARLRDIKQSVFWRNMWKHWSWTSEFTLLIGCSAYSSTLKMEATRSYEQSVNFYQTTWRHIPEDSTLHKHRRQNLKSHFTLYSNHYWNEGTSSSAGDLDRYVTIGNVPDFIFHAPPVLVWRWAIQTLLYTTSLP
jgi:hypothetical protein